MSPSFSAAYEAAFPKTDVGVIEIKIVPAATLLATQSKDNYFNENNDLFRPLFRYIQTNDIPMTVPVEAEINPGVMYFYVGNDHVDRELKNTESVHVIEIPERTVLSLGVRGSYSEKNFNEAQGALIVFLAEQNEWEQTGPARAIYWNGPFTPGLLKRSEVHIPVKRTQ